MSRSKDYYNIYTVLVLTDSEELEFHGKHGDGDEDEMVLGGLNSSVRVSAIRGILLGEKNFGNDDGDGEP